MEKHHQETELEQYGNITSALVTTTAMALAAASILLEGCAVKGKSSVEYADGTLIVAADPVQKQQNLRRATRNQVLSQLGANYEGKQKDGSYVICADMRSVYSCPDESCVDDNDRKRLAGRFEPILLDQASYLLTADCTSNVQGLGIHKTRTDGDFVCLWTTKPEDIKCR